VVVVRGGLAPAGAVSATFPLQDGWTVEVRAAVPGGDLLDDWGAVVLLAAGSAMSALLAALVYVLGTGRARALGLVEERTEQLQFQALHDSLTGLPNRALILDRLEQMLARARRSYLPAAVMLLDLDDFKDINDTLGHEAGDQLLTVVAERLAGTLRGGDTVGRLGGDEFVLLVEGTSTARRVEVAGERILEVLARPIEIAGAALPLSISASIGVAVDRGQSAGELLRDADIALHRAKAGGKRRPTVFAPAMHAAALSHRALDLDLRGALGAGQFFLVYQPTIDLQTNEFTGVGPAAMAAPRARRRRPRAERARA
jgi:diguanylate cyclase (GGDEF)-like protein